MLQWDHSSCLDVECEQGPLHAGCGVERNEKDAAFVTPCTCVVSVILTQIKADGVVSLNFTRYAQFPQVQRFQSLPQIPQALGHRRIEQIIDSP